MNSTSLMSGRTSTISWVLSATPSAVTTPALRPNTRRASTYASGIAVAPRNAWAMGTARYDPPDTAYTAASQSG